MQRIWVDPLASLVILTRCMLKHLKLQSWKICGLQLLNGEMNCDAEESKPKYLKQVDDSNI